jgi:putative ABC transport system ATP-binding protein
MIRVQQLQFNYPGTPFQLTIPDWELPDCSQTAIVGPSGSGKTTLLHLLSGILLPQAGRIEMGDLELTRASEATRRDFRARQVGLVFQRFELIEYLKVRGNILLPYLINRSLKIDALVRTRLQHLAERTGIAHLLDRPIQKLSQGEQQRVAICRALINRPRWLFADEPTGNLDPENKQLIVNLLREQAEQMSATLIMVTHDVALVAQFARQIDFRTWLGQSPSPQVAGTRT